MKVLILAQLHSVHTKRWCDWFMDHDVDILPLNSIDPNVIRRQISLFKPDIIHAFFVPLWGAAANAVNFHPCIVHVLGSDMLRKDTYDIELIKKVLREADVVFGFNEELVEKSLALGAPKDHTHKIGLGVDTGLFKPGYSPFYNKWHTTSKTKVIMSCRHMNPYYNHETIIRALPVLFDKYGDINYVQVNPNGDPDYYNKIADLIDEVKMTEYVHSNIEIPNHRMPYTYNACDVAIGIPTTDGISMATLESLACKVPYVGTDCSSNRMLLPPELVVDPKDSKQVAKALIAAIDRRFKTSLLEEGRKIVMEEYEQDKVMGAALKIYRSLV